MTEPNLNAITRIVERWFHVEAKGWDYVLVAHDKATGHVCVTGSGNKDEDADYIAGVLRSTAVQLDDGRGMEGDIAVAMAAVTALMEMVGTDTLVVPDEETVSSDRYLLFKDVPGGTMLHLSDTPLKPSYDG